MRAFKAPEGFSLIGVDISALEPSVLTYLSRDPTLLQVYGPEAWPHHDIYFISGMSMPNIKDKILPSYSLEDYDLERLNTLKKEEKKLRKQILKPSYLGWSYGLGAAKLSGKLDISREEAKTILTALDRRFRGVKIYEESLQEQWRRNGGYIINGRGMPIACHPKKLKDILNRQIQSTGHAVLSRFLYHMKSLQPDPTIFKPYIPDYHDETIWAVKKGYEQELIDMYNDSMSKTNAELGWDVEIKFGEPMIGEDLRVRSL